MKFEEGLRAELSQCELSQVEASEIHGGPRSGPSGAGGIAIRRRGRRVCTTGAWARASARTRRGRRGAGRAGVLDVDTIATGISRPFALLGEVGGRARGHAQLQLAAHDLAGARGGSSRRLRRRGASRRKRPSPITVVGMMLHQDASSHAWVSGRDVGPGGRPWTMRPARSDSGFFVSRGRHSMSSFQALSEVIAERGLSLLALCPIGRRTTGTRRRPAARST